MRRVLVPLAPGVFSAAGLLLSEIEHEFLQTLPARGENASAEMLHAAYRELEAEAERALVAEGVSGDASRFPLRRHPLRRAGVRADAAGGGRPPDPGAIAADFGAEHHRTYGHASADAPIDIVNVKLTARAGGNGDAPYDPLAGLGAASEERRAAPTSGREWARSTCRCSRGARSSAPRRGRSSSRSTTRRASSRPAARDARRAREHRHRAVTRDRSRHARGDQERPRVGGRRDGARRHAQRVLTRRPRHDGLLDGALRPRRRARRAGPDARRPARHLPDDHAPRARALRRGRRPATSSSPTTRTASAASTCPTST